MGRPRSLVDWDTAGCLDNGWHAVLAVEETGETWPWLLNPDGDADNAPARLPYHEFEGPLPEPYRDRAARCNGPTLGGTPCRRRGNRYNGGRCALHAEAAHRG